MIAHDHMMQLRPKVNFFSTTTKFLSINLSYLKNLKAHMSYTWFLSLVTSPYCFHVIDMPLLPQMFVVSFRSG